MEPKRGRKDESIRIRDRTEDWVWMQLWEQTRFSVWNKVERQVERPIGGPVRDQVRDQALEENHG